MKNRRNTLDKKLVVLSCILMAFVICACNKSVQLDEIVETTMTSMDLSDESEMMENTEEQNVTDDTEESGEGKTEAENEEDTQVETEEVTETPTEKETEKATEKPTEKETEKATEKVTEKETEKTTEKATEKETEKATEKPTEKETEKATEKPTEKETESKETYIIPEGCKYIVYATGEVLEEGKEFPSELGTKDQFVTADYIYKYDFTFPNEWKCDVIDESKSEYEEICSYIAGAPVVDLWDTFRDCKNLTVAPSIPSTIKTMCGTFWGCTKLIEAPVIPEGVLWMDSTFEDCYSLVIAHELPSSVEQINNIFKNCWSLEVGPTVIPSKVKYMNYAFYECPLFGKAPQISSDVLQMKSAFVYCIGMTGEMQIDANPEAYDDCFAGVSFEEQNLILIGSSTMIEELKATGK